jgi:hypothetical protein
MPETANISQLRRDIDSGRTGDKVAAPDPAAAPLELTMRQRARRSPPKWSKWLKRRSCEQAPRLPKSPRKCPGRQFI